MTFTIHRRAARRAALVIAALVLSVVGLSACFGSGNSANSTNQRAEQNQLGIYNVNQPLPVFPKSQLRQTLIEVERAQAQPTPTTTFFFNQGSQDPISQCPSIGFPVPTTDQISNPQQLVNDPNDNGSQVVGQIDPNGVYSGDSSGTYVLCLNDAGTAYASYWEGFVYTVSGAASWNTATHSISDVTNPTGSFSVLPASQTHQSGTTQQNAASAPKA